MGLAIDTIATSVVNPGAAVTATAAAAGDSLTVRNCDVASLVLLEHVIRGGATAGQAGVRSPRMHDNVRGFRFNSGQVISIFDMPQELGQPLVPGDTLITEVTGGAAETDALALQVYYGNMPGLSARLHSWGDISGNVRNIKTVQVAVAATGAAGTWVDTVITTTESLLKTKTDYAVLGVLTDLATMLVGLKGPDTGNLRICAPGTTDASDTSDFFVRQAIYTGRPWIPVIAGDNRGSTFVSTFHHGATQAPNITLVCAELATPLGT